MPAALSSCPQCGEAIEGVSSADVQEAWTSSPTGIAQLGYLMLVLLGGLIALGGMLYVVLVLLIGSEIVEGALALAITAVGVVLARQGVYALDAARWRSLSLSPVRVWIALLILVWALGTLVVQLLPGGIHRTLPPLITVGSWLASLLFLSATARGLKAPVERRPLASRLAPRHVVYLSTALSASFSTALSLVLESAFLGMGVVILLIISKWLGDPSLVELFKGIVDDPRALRHLEEMIVRSPLALIGLGCMMVVVAPAVEELVKGLPLLLFAHRRSGLTEQNAILLAVAGGVGFAFAENVGYLSIQADLWWLVFWFRVGAAVMHGTASGLIGRAWYHGVGRRQWGTMLLNLGLGWGVHAMWNALALAVGWFAYKEVTEGVLFCVLGGVLPLTLLFVAMAHWGIWVSDT